MKVSVWIKSFYFLISLSLVTAWLPAQPIQAADPPSDRLVRELFFCAYSPGTNKQLAEAHKFIANRIKQLGFKIDFKPMTRQGVVQNMWFSHKFDLGTLYLTGRPTRVDPHMILSKLYHSRDDVVAGYNWSGYRNKEFDALIDVHVLQIML